MKQKEYSLNINDLLADGFTKKMAGSYLKAVMDEFNNPAFDKEYIEWAHAHGFFAENAYAYELTDENVNDFLSDYEFYRTWPLNNWTRIWVNDKLTLKMMMSDPELKGFMPDYYFYSINGTLRPLMDLDIRENTMEDTFLRLIREKGEIACKPNNGERAIGFAKFAYAGGCYYYNDEKKDENWIREYLKTDNNSLYSEYLHPSEQFARYSDKINTLRIVVINEHGYDPKIVGGYFRIPNRGNGETNYTVLDGTNMDKFNIFCEYDHEAGTFGNAKLTLTRGTKNERKHPDTGVDMEGPILNHDDLMKKVMYVCKKLCCLEYIGFDIGVSSNGFKCMEINTLPGTKYMQIFKPFFKDDYLGDYFRRKIEYLDSLSDEEKKKRNTIIR